MFGKKKDDEDDLEKQFKAIEDTTQAGAQVSGGTDTRAILGIARLGRAIVRLNKTTTHLAKVNIWLTVVIVVAALVQIVLMLHPAR